MSFEKNQKTEKVITLLDDFLKNINEDIEYGELSKYVQTAQDSVLRRKNELKSNLYFIVVIGGVKSGKSSLINVLTEKKIATAKLGMETTTYPSIISYGEYDEIIVYRKKSTSNEINSKALFQLVIDHIKGFEDSEIKLKDFVDILLKELNEKNVGKYVASPIREKDILLVNIKINGNVNSLVKDNISIIDTPGIDGIKATASGNREDETDYIGDLLIERSDYMLFLQSSITPLTHESLNFITGSKTRKTILVHNKFSINHWRTKEEDINEQVKPTIKLFENNGIMVNAIDIDIGKALDSIFNENLKDGFSPESLLEESKLQFLKNDIIDSIESNGKVEHLKVQYDELLASYEELTNHLGEKQKEYSNLKKDLKNKLNESFGKIEKSLEAKISSEIIFNEKLRQDGNNSGFTVEQFKYDLSELIDTVFNNAGIKMEIEQFTRINQALKNEFVKQHNDKLRSALDISKFNYYIDDEIIEVEIDNINTILKDVDEPNKLYKFILNKQEDYNNTNELQISVSDLKDFTYVPYKSEGGFTKADSWKRFTKTVVTLGFGDDIDADKTHFNLKETQNKLKMEQELLGKEYKSYEDKLKTSLYNQVKEYKSEILAKKQTIMNNFDTYAYFKKEQENLEKAGQFSDQLKKLCEDVKNVK